MVSPPPDGNSREHWTLNTLKQLMDERQRTADERFKGVDERFKRERGEQESKVSDALAAQKELTNAAFVASEKAIVKAEGAQNAHNTLANGLQARLDDQAKDFIGRPEFDQRFGGLEGKIQDLRESRSTDKGKDSGLELAKANQRWIIGIGLTVILGLIGLAVKVF